MEPYGSTRTTFGARHALIAPDGHVSAPIPGWRGATGVVLVSPQMSAFGARFQQYLALLEPGAEAGAPPAGVERFALAIDGVAHVETDDARRTLEPGGYAFLPAHLGHALSTDGPCRLLVFETRHVAHPGGSQPAPVFGALHDAGAEPFLGDPQVQVKRLLPEGPEYDVAFNIMQFEPGGRLPFVETHPNEHGLYMLEGEGVYRLEDRWYPVRAGDTVWMGPFCPQWFGALGPQRASYLIYKDQNRDWLAAGGAR